MPGRGRVPRPAHDTSTPKRICRPRALGLTPIHKRATLHTSLLNKLVTTASPSCADKPDNITDDVYGLSDVDFEESLSLSGLEHLSHSQSIFPLNASFVSARSLLETNLPEVSPETSNDENSPENHDGLENRNFDNINLDNIENECKDLSDDMFQSRLEMSIRNHESQFCKTTQYRREVERLFEKVEMSILDSSCLRQNAEVSVTSTMFENDVFVEDVKENQIVNNQLSSCIRTSNNFRQDKCDFYGLPKLAKSLFGIYKNVDKLYEWQNECLCLDAIKKRKNLIYALPTSGGKTLVAEILMLKEILGRKKNVLFVLPFVALVQEKVWGLSPFALQLEFLIEEYAAGKGNFPPKKRRNKNSIYVATLEKGLGLVRNLIELNRLNEIGLIVVDELHLLGEPSRGSTLEMLLASVMFIPNDIQIIGMSATIGNIDELAKFLNAEIYSNQFRPVELKEYVKVGHEISLISWTEGGMDLNTHRRVDYTYSAQVEKIDPDHLGGLVMEVIPKGSCLIFCPTKKNCENVAVLLCKVIFRQLLEYRAKEKQSLLRALKEEAGSECSILAGAVPWGVAYHHSGLTAEERRLLEDSFRAGVINVLCCTSTLAAGVNLPATRVILRSPHVGREFISLSTYKQMAGRAGRAGYGCVGESIIICPPERYGQLRELLNQPMDKATSNLHGNDGTPLRGFVLSAIGLNMVANREQILNLLQTTLMAVQADRLGLCLKTLTNTTLKNLIESGAVEVIQPGLEPSAPLTKHGSSMSHSNEHVDGGSNQKLVVYTNSIFKVSKLGKAAIKGCMDLKVAYQLYEDMKLAQKDLVVMGELHLLYLVTPYEYTDIQPNMVVYYSIYSSLDSEGLQTAQVLGITESSAVRMVTGKSITNVPERVLSRFYVTLMLHELWRQVPVAEVAEKYHVSRGTVQSMMMSTAAFASNVLRFCEELEEFWAFQDLLVNFTKRISHCCAPELLPLMELPSVKKARAIQLYKAGYKRIEDIAKANASDLVESIQHLSNKVATQLISSAKLMLIEKVENLREEAEDVMDGIGAISIY